MSKSKKKNTKVRDMHPKKDAKGGGPGKPSPQTGGTSPLGGGGTSGPSSLKPTYT